MVSNPLEAEATGQEFITSTFRGHEFLVPTDVDTWPLHAVRRCRGLKLDDDGEATAELAVDHAAVQYVLRGILRDQWDAFRSVAPKRRHWIPATQQFAEAVGFPSRGPADIVFGALPWLLNIIDEWPEKVESDLDRFWGIDYGERWLFQGGRRRLTLRKIHARLTNLPIDSALAIAMNGGKLHQSDAAIVLMDLFEHGVGLGRRHPSRPMPAHERAVRDAHAAQEEKAIAERKERMAKRKTRQSGVENARANARREMERREAHAQEG